MLKKYVPLINDASLNIADEVDKALVEENCPAVTNADKSTTCENNVVANEPSSTDSKSAIVSFFEKNNIIIITEKCVPSTDPIMYLVNAIAECLPLGEDFLHLLRKSICNKEGHFEYNLSKLDVSKRGAIIKIANIMKNCGVFSQMLINTWTISGNVSSAARVKNFLSGVWLELYSQQVAINVVKKYAKDHNLSYEVYSNLKVEDKQGVKHEIDLMFSLGSDMVFGAEIKSGLNFCDYDRYRLTAEWMHLIPDRFLLFNSTLTDENATKCISYFYQYFICGISTFENTLNQMLDKAING